MKSKTVILGGVPRFQSVRQVYSADNISDKKMPDNCLLHQVAREGKVDELLSLVQLESLENIRTWVNR